MQHLGMKRFKETQRFDQWWVWTLLLGIAAIWVWGIIQQVLLGSPFGDKPMTDAGLIMSALIPLGIIVLFRIMTLRTEITSDGIRVKYFPLWSTQLNWNQIKQAKIIKYGFVGYGIRFSDQYGTVYNVKGSLGLLVEKVNGKKILIGTQKPDELQTVVNQYFQSIF